MNANGPLWSPRPEQVSSAPITDFTRLAQISAGRDLAGDGQLHQWSIDQREDFWDLVWDFAGIVGDKGERAIEHAGAMPGARFFPDATLNFAENFLARNDDEDALVFWGENKVKRRMTWAQLQALVSRMQQALRAHGVGPGDRVAAMMPNLPETIAAMLAATSLGAIWSSCSPDFGERGVLDRFGQIEPKVFITCDGYWYNGKAIGLADKLAAIVEKLNTAKCVVVVPYLDRADEVAARLPRSQTLERFLQPYSAKPVEFEPLPFSHPVYILFSSGTTGIPKCIVHSAGGTLLQHAKEIALHGGVKPGDRMFFFTTCGWMMWNWLASGLVCGATVLLYDGSPFYPDGNILFDFADAERCTLFGISAKFIDAVKKAGLRPIATHKLQHVRTILSTGSPLAPESFDFVYEGIKAQVHLASMSGGTDIISCFVLGNPTRPVWRGEIQGAGLGMAVEVWDDAGAPLARGKGELVCTRPFPSMPVMFWNDPDGAKYRRAYFERFDNVWCHGDYAQWTEHGGMVIHGRSDATLNPGGVRIGTAEIYNQVEQIPEVLEGLAIGQEWDNDVRVILFVRLKSGCQLDEDLVTTIRHKVRYGASPRHVPAKVIAVGDIPRTKSGKITELAVRDMVHGRQVKNREALANPEALDLFRDLPELAE
jgi:acetoacetyl-CoA synthetase